MREEKKREKEGGERERKEEKTKKGETEKGKIKNITDTYPVRWFSYQYQWQ